jgi:hypothetical protein
MRRKPHSRTELERFSAKRNFFGFWSNGNATSEAQALRGVKFILPPPQQAIESAQGTESEWERLNKGAIYAPHQATFTAHARR